MSSTATGTALSIVVNTLKATETQQQIKQLLPPDVPLDRFTTAAIAAITHNADILDCDKQSLYNAVLSCAQDGLLPDGKQAAIVKFNTRVKTAQGEQWVKKAQRITMVEGAIHLLGKAGIRAYACSVYANDSIELWNDDSGQHIKHTPVTFGDRGERIGAYAVGRDKNGMTWVEAMSMEDLEVPKRATKSKDKDGNLYGPWKETPGRMEQKACLHRLSKRIPSAALREDDEFNDEPSMVTVAEPPASRPTTRAVVPGRPAALQAVVDQAPPPPPPAQPPEDEEEF